MARKRAEPNVKLAEPEHLPKRAVERPTYPEGSVREKRQALMIEAEALRARLKDCAHCRDLKERANTLAAEAEALLPAAVEEGGGQPRKVQRVKYDQTPTEPDVNDDGDLVPAKKTRKVRRKK